MSTSPCGKKKRKKKKKTLSLYSQLGCISISFEWVARARKITTQKDQTNHPRTTELWQRIETSVHVHSRHLSDEAVHVTCKCQEEEKKKRRRREEEEKKRRRREEEEKEKRRREGKEASGVQAHVNIYIYVRWMSEEKRARTRELEIVLHENIIKKHGPSTHLSLLGNLNRRCKFNRSRSFSQDKIICRDWFIS